MEPQYFVEEKQQQLLSNRTVTREAYIKPCVLPTSEAVSLLKTFEDPSDGFHVSIPLASPPNATTIV